MQKDKDIINKPRKKDRKTGRYPKTKKNQETERGSKWRKRNGYTERDEETES